METTHLPGVRWRQTVTASGAVEELPYTTLTSACGKRGRISTREHVGGALRRDLFLSADEGVCPECLVLWDAAEEKGLLAVVWTHNAREEWLGPGAVVERNEPSPWACANCGRGVRRPRASGCFAAVVRVDERQQVTP